VRVGTVPHYITPKEKLSPKHEGATLRKIGAKLRGFKTQKIVKNPLQKGTQSIGT
jgi:hypothetical protein